MAIPAFIFLGWLVGIVLGLIVGPFALVVFGLPVGGIVALLLGTPFAFLAPIITAVLGLFPALVATLIALFAGLSLLMLALAAVVTILVAYVLVYLLGYVVATVAVSPLLPGAPLTLPLAGPVTTPVPVVIPATPGEFFARGLVIGFNATVNALLLLMFAAFDPRWAPIVASYAFIVVSLAAVIFIARTRFYQGLIGWSAWFFPVSWVATLPGLILFIFNSITWLITQNRPYSIALDFTTGVVESSDGFILNWSGFSGGFSLGNFTFLMRQATTAAFTVQSVSAHETGHSLNTAAFGGVVLWINAVDENLAPFARQNLAYGELLAEGHSATMPAGTPARNDFSLAMW